MKGIPYLGLATEKARSLSAVLVLSMPRSNFRLKYLLPNNINKLNGDAVNDDTTMTIISFIIMMTST